MKNFGTLLATGVFFAGFFVNHAAVAQQGRDKVENTILACLNGVSDIDEMSQSLGALGWTEVANSDLTDQALRAYRARLLAQELIFAAPGPRFKSAWERAEGNANGLRRLVQLPDEPTSRHFFVRDDSESLLELGLIKYPQHKQHTCGIIVTAEFAASSIAPIASQTFSKDTVPVVSLRTKAFDLADRVRFLSTIVLDQVEIARLIDSEFPYIGYLTTFSADKQKE